VAFEKYLDLPVRMKKTRFELAMNLDDPERVRLSERGWHVVDPHRVAKTAARYRHYLASAAAEFTAIKGVDVAWQTGWMSDRAATFLAMGRPVVTEDTGAAKYLPKQSGFRFINDLESASAAVNEVIADWPALSRQSRAVAVELFDSERNLRKILGLPRPPA
jgi:glycosyltransferase involved in cell wall biosynthesis